MEVRRNMANKGEHLDPEGKEDLKEKKWVFHGFPWELIHLVRFACVGYELYQNKREGVLRILCDNEKFDDAAAEFGITYDAVKDAMHTALHVSDLIDKQLNEVHNKKGRKG